MAQFMLEALLIAAIGGLLGILTSLSGAVVLVAHGELDTLTGLHFFRGDLWMLFAVTMWSVYSVLLKNKPKELPQLSLLIGSIICALAMLLRYSANQEKAADDVENAVQVAVKKLKSLSAGKMGYSTGEVGDLVVEAL